MSNPWLDTQAVTWCHASVSPYVCDSINLLWCYRSSGFVLSLILILIVAHTVLVVISIIIMTIVSSVELQLYLFWMWPNLISVFYLIVMTMTLISSLKVLLTSLVSGGFFGNVQLLDFCKRINHRTKRIYKIRNCTNWKIKISITICKLKIVWQGNWEYWGHSTSAQNKWKQKVSYKLDSQQALHC